MRNARVREKEWMKERVRNKRQKLEKWINRKEERNVGRSNKKKKKEEIDT